MGKYICPSEVKTLVLSTMVYQHEIRIEKMELKKLRSVVSVKFLKQFSVKVKVEKWFP